MELRKVQLTGGSSLTVTLPKSWAEKANLEAGDVVGCTEQSDGSMAVHPHAKSDDETRTFALPSDDQESRTLFRKIIAAYLGGFDAVTVNGSDELSREARDAVRKAKTRIMGLEIIEEDLASVTVQDFLDPKEFHVDKALRRMQMLTRSMQRSADDLLAGSDEATLVSLEERDDEVDRLFWLVNKQFHALLGDASYAAKMELSPSQALNILLVARLCERTADHAERVGQQARKLPREDDHGGFVELLGERWRVATSLFQDAMDTFRHQDPEQADRVIDRANQLRDDQADLLKQATDVGAEAVVHLAFVIESIGRTEAYAADVAELAINHDVASSHGR